MLDVLAFSPVQLDGYCEVEVIDWERTTEVKTKVRAILLTFQVGYVGHC